MLGRIRGYGKLLRKGWHLPLSLQDRAALTWWQLRHTLARRGVGSTPRPLAVNFLVHKSTTCQLTFFHPVDVVPFLEVFVEQVYRQALHLPFPVRRIVDLGANVGAATVWFLEHYPRAQVVAFEPHPALAARCRQLVAGYGSRVRVEPIGLGARQGDAVLFSDDDHTGSSLQRRRPNQRPVSVKLAHLEELLDRATEPGGKVDLLKFDVEGAEQHLFNAPDAVLTRVRAFVGEAHEDLLPVGALDRWKKRLHRLSYRITLQACAPQRIILFATRVLHEGA